MEKPAEEPGLEGVEEPGCILGQPGLGGAALPSPPFAFRLPGGHCDVRAGPRRWWPISFSE